MQSLPLVLFVIAVLSLAWVAASSIVEWASHKLAQRGHSELLADVLARLAAVPVFLLGLYLILQAAGLTRLEHTPISGNRLSDKLCDKTKGERKYPIQRNWILL